MGEDQEGPTVILNGGLGGGVLQWAWVQPEVADLTLSEVGRETGDLGDIPLVVLSAGNGALDGWLELQAELAELSTDGVHRVSEEANHGSLVTDQEHSRAAVGAIREAVEAVREDR